MLLPNHLAFSVFICSSDILEYTLFGLFLNIVLPNEFIVEGKIRLSNLVHIANALLPIRSTLGNPFILSKLRQLANALLPIRVMVYGIHTSLRLAQLVNPLSAISITGSPLCFSGILAEIICLFRATTL